MALTDPANKPGPFAKAFIEALQEPTASFPDFFKTVRVRIYDETGGRQRTWEANKLSDPSFSFFPSKEGETPPATVTGDAPITSLPREEAYKKVIALDNIPAYQSFIKAFPDDEALPDIQYNLAVRREAEVWGEALRLDTPEAYWTYIQAYPDGGNVGAARERLAMLGKPATQPDDFVPLSYPDIPPPLESGEVVASSASMPVAFLPPPPHMRLPAVSPRVVATLATAAAIPVTLGVGPRAVPTMPDLAVHPAWARPVMAIPNRAAPRSAMGSSGAAAFRAGPAGEHEPGATPRGRAWEGQPLTSFHAPQAVAPLQPGRPGVEPDHPLAHPATIGAVRALNTPPGPAAAKPIIPIQQQNRIGASPSVSAQPWAMPMATRAQAAVAAPGDTRRFPGMTNPVMAPRGFPSPGTRPQFGGPPSGPTGFVNRFTAGPGAQPLGMAVPARSMSAPAVMQRPPMPQGAPRAPAPTRQCPPNAKSC